MPGKSLFEGKVTSVQPRIRLHRSFDEASHSYLGYVLQIEGELNNEERKLSVAVGKGAQTKHAFQVGDIVKGACAPVENSDKETAEFYKASALVVITRSPVSWEPPPWLGCPPDLETYRCRGHRRLDARTYTARCGPCVWGCLMPVEMTIDNWNPEKVQYRQETFCYGPKSCLFYSPGSTRKVPGRNGIIYEEEGWVDEDATAYRGADE